jgi:hypothetical protein
MRILLAAMLASCMLLGTTPASSEPVFILNCRLINVDDKLFRQHCKAQDRECGGVSCFAGAKRKARTLTARMRAARVLETPLSAVENGVESSPDVASTGISADAATERTADPSTDLGNGGDSPAAGGRRPRAAPSTQRKQQELELTALRADLFFNVNVPQ